MTKVMHKGDEKYVTDEDAKQRVFKGILKKLTPLNVEKLSGQVKQVNIDNPGTLYHLVAQIHNKAAMEPFFCEMYASFCYHLANELPAYDNGKITFRKILMEVCQIVFEGRRDGEEANRGAEEGEGKETEEEGEDITIRTVICMLGSIRFIGELYKKRMLTERIMHQCIKELLGEYQNPDEGDVEALCELMRTIGDMIDHPKAKKLMDAYFQMMHKLSDNMKLSSRVRIMLKDLIDLRNNKWQQRRKVEGPKKIDKKFIEMLLKNGKNNLVGED